MNGNYSYTSKKYLKILFESLYAFGNILMLTLIIYGGFFADTDSATVIGFGLVFFVPLYIFGLFISPILIQRDYIFLKEKNYLEHPFVISRILLYSASLVSIPLGAILSNFV